MGELFRLALGALALLLGIAAATAAPVTLSGEVTYRERVALPENGTLRISLVDLEAPDQPRVQAEGAIASPGQVPLSFSLNFDDAIFAAGKAYGLRAEIISGGQVWFSTTEPLPVDLEAPTGLTVLTTFTGRINDPAARPAVDPAPLFDVTWTAREIGGVAVTPGESSLSIARDMRAGGRGGCNSYFTQAQIASDTLAFSAVAATRMACDEARMAQEAVFFDALTATRFWRLADGQLTLLDAGGETLMRLSQTTR